MSTEELSDLSRLWERTEKNSQSAIKWISDAAKVSPAVASGQNRHLASLYDAIYQASVMRRTARNKPGIGLFGESQAGKSYLVSAMASNDEHRLITRLGRETYDFVQKINPQGSGKESTGLVTRFTMYGERDEEADPDYPVRLTFLAECEIVKILVNSYYSDFPDTATGIGDIRQLSRQVMEDLGRLPADKSGRRIPENEITSLEKYIESRHGVLNASLGEAFWTLGRERIIYLNAAERARYYSVLWGGNNRFRDLFLRLAGTLEHLDHLETVMAPIRAVVVARDSISLINVDALKKLESPDDSEVFVKTMSGVKQIRLSELAALTAEIRIPVENPKFDIIKNNDVLDFPGYRGRLDRDLSALDNPAEREIMSDAFLRGKVAYLFEKYTENYDLNALILCTAADSQINSPRIEDVISRWIRQTQGGDPQARSRHNCGLFWALTKFDKRIAEDLDKENRVYGRGGLLQQTVLEKFGQCEWLKNWDGSEDNPRPFSNIFLVRKPGLDCSFIDKADSRERGIREGYQQRLDLMKQDLCRDSDIRTYVRNPEAAWDAVLKVNDGGLDNLVKSIQAIDIRAIKKDAVQNALSLLLRERLIPLFQQWNAVNSSQDERQAAKKKAFAGIFYAEVRKRKDLLACQFGDFVNVFNMPLSEIKNAWDEVLNEIRFQPEEEQSLPEAASGAAGAPAPEPEEIPDFDDLDFDILGEPTESQDCKAAPDPESLGKTAGAVSLRLRDSEKLYNKWVDWMQGLAASRSWNRRMLPLSPEFVATTAQEIVNFAGRTDLRKVLIDQVDRLSSMDSGNRDTGAKVPEVVNLILSDFIYTLNGTAVQEKPAVETVADLDSCLGDEPDKNRKSPLAVWAQAMSRVFVENAGYQSRFGFSEKLEEALKNLVNEYRNIESNIGHG